mmetsp:Transcript_11023/g.16487  ORF Transcript_11023/g.16487 Transcript_11023/m.16487 type:complete len:306 (+) Transcript_11023:141-1058(+)
MLLSVEVVEDVCNFDGFACKLSARRSSECVFRLMSTYSSEPSLTSSLHSMSASFVDIALGFGGPSVLVSFFLNGFSNIAAQCESSFSKSSPRKDDGWSFFSSSKSASVLTSALSTALVTFDHFFSFEIFLLSWLHETVYIPSSLLFSIDLNLIFLRSGFSTESFSTSSSVIAFLGWSSVILAMARIFFNSGSLVALLMLALARLSILLTKLCVPFDDEEIVVDFFSLSRILFVVAFSTRVPLSSTDLDRRRRRLLSLLLSLDGDLESLLLRRLRRSRFRFLLRLASLWLSLEDPISRLDTLSRHF